MTRVAILGSGGREAALAWKIASEIGESNVYVLPGNDGLSSATGISCEDFVLVSAFCREEGIDLVIVGSEDLLARGAIDVLVSNGLRAFGPYQAASILESSKSEARRFMARHGVSSPTFAIFDKISEGREAVCASNGCCVVKYDGLAAGKGVTVCANLDEAQAALDALEAQYGPEVRFIVEERLEGVELSLIGITDGQTIRLLPPAQDHKRLLDGDRGPNTGGMGAFAPVPWFDIGLRREVERSIIEPTMRGLQSEFPEYCGFLYFGIMLTSRGPMMIEYNVRMGDPEAQVIFPVMRGELLYYLSAALSGELASTPEIHSHGFCCAVIAASKDYPHAKTHPTPISIEGNLPCGAQIFPAGVKETVEGLQATGGRVLTCSGTGETLELAVANAYTAIAQIAFEGMQYRQDIGQKGLYRPQELGIGRAM